MRVEEQEEVPADLVDTTASSAASIFVWSSSRSRRCRGVASGFAAGRFCGSELEAQQVLDQVTLFSIGEAQVHTGVVVIHDGIQVSETSVVIEAAFEVG